MTTVRRRAALAALAFVTLALAACGPRPCPLPPRDPSAPVAPLLWKVQRADGAGPSLWLYGTIHDSGAEDIAPEAWTALAAAPRFISELGELELDPDEFRDESRLPRGPGLDRLLPADDWFELRLALQDVIREDALARVRPWYAMVMLTRKVTGKAVPGMDVLLTDRARSLGRPIEHLETWKDQLPLLAQAIGPEQLSQAIRARRTMRCELVTARAAYVAGDLPAMERIFGVDPTGAMLAPRNRRWLPQLVEHLADGGGFVAVGIGHLVGPDGLPTMLAAAGYRVERAPAR